MLSFVLEHSLGIFRSKTLKVFILLFFPLLSYSQKGVRIAYIDTEYILQNVSEYRVAETELENKAQKWKSEIEQRIAALENEKSQFNNERILLTDALIREREEELQIIENEILNYQQKRFGPNGDLVIQKKQLIQPIQDQIFNAIQEIANSKKYDFVFDKSADVVMLYSDNRYNISEQVLRTINRTSNRKQVKNSKERSEAKKEKSIVEIDTAKDDRQKQIDERNAKRKEEIAKRRAEIEAKRTARKMEIERRKKEAMEARKSKVANKESEEINDDQNLDSIDPSLNNIEDQSNIPDDSVKTKTKNDSTKKVDLENMDRESRKKALEEKLSLIHI